MAEPQKVNASIHGVEYTFYVDVDRSLTTKPCKHCGAESEDRKYGDNAIDDYFIISMQDEYGNDVESSHSAFKTALRRLHQQVKNKEPICLGCYSKLDIDISSD